MEVIFLKKDANRAIACNVNNCQYNCMDENYCSLDSIVVTSHEANPTKIECTDCGSFKVKSGCNCK